MKPTGIKAADALRMAVAGMSFAAGLDRSVAGPVSAFIEPSNICNLHCPQCAAGAGKLDRPQGQMSPDDFRRILDALPSSVKTLYLWGQGEPFIAQGFTGMIRLASDRGYRTIVSTNGHFLTDAEAIVTSGLDTLIVSLDGADEAVYSQYRVNGNFTEVIEGIRGICEAKRRLGTGPFVEIQCLLTAQTVPQRVKVVGLGRELGADRVVFKTMQVSYDETASDFLPKEAAHSRYTDPDAENRVTERYFWASRRCLRIYYTFQVDWQGNVLPCCFDKNSQFIMGNLFMDSGRDAWNGPFFREFRKILGEKGRVYPMCRDCTEGLKRMRKHA